MNLKELGECKTVPQFIEVVKPGIEELGFTDFAFNVIDAPINFGISTISKELNQAIMDSEILKDLAEYHYGELIFLEPILSAIGNVPVKCGLKIRHEKLYNLMSKSDYSNALILNTTLPKINRNAIMLIFSKGVPAIEFQNNIEKMGSILHLLTDTISHFAGSLFPYESIVQYFKDIDKDPITEKHLELLKLMMKGYKLKEACNLRCISIDTGNKHIASIKLRLQAKTVAEAVYKATKAGLL